MEDEEQLYYTGDWVEYAWGILNPNGRMVWRRGRVRWANPILTASGQKVYVYTVDGVDGSSGYGFGARELRRLEHAETN